MSEVIPSIKGTVGRQKAPSRPGISFPQNFLTALAVGRGLWTEVNSSAEQLKQRCPGNSPQIQLQQEELSQR